MKNFLQLFSSNVRSTLFSSFGYGGLQYLNMFSYRLQYSIIILKSHKKLHHQLTVFYLPVL